MIEAVKVQLRGIELRIPSLTGAHLEDYEAELNALLAPKPEQTMKETLTALVTLVLAACKETHPELTREVLRSNIDLRNRGLVFGALLGTASGFEPVPPGEAQRP